MYLSEEFLSVQGEVRSGELSIFIRFATCNRTCEHLKVEYTTPDGKVRYGCDSYDSVDKAFKNNWTRVNCEDLIAILEKYSNCKKVVITGGEPLLNANKPEFKKFIKHLIKNKYQITIETNGDLKIVDIELFKKVIFSISPKGEIQDKDYWFMNKNSYIKALYGINISTEYLKNLQNKGMTIYIMPLGESYKQTSQRLKETFEYCVKNGFNLTDRLHLNIFKDEAKSESLVMDNMMSDNRRWG